jgi:hypothetical protein
VTNRDLRRTWKTLAGKAGVPKEIRDRLQNHILQDVSSKSYDRWSYMPEKRAGMAKWDEFVTTLLSKGGARGLTVMAARLVRDEGVAGSNPATPTKLSRQSNCDGA